MLMIVGGTIFTAGLGGLFHFLYKLSGNILLLGMFVPVNESVWEHLKLVFLPMLLWCALVSWVGRRSINFLYVCMSAVLHVMAFIVAAFYIFLAVFGKDSIIFDLTIYALGMLYAVALGEYSYSPGSSHDTAALVLVVALLTLFPACTLYPPRLEPWRDSETGGYGIL